MDAARIRTLVDPKKKFIPFDVRTGSGGSYHVASREMFWMAPDGVVLLVYLSGEGVVLIDSDEVTECFRVVKKPRS